MARETAIASPARRRWRLGLVPLVIAVLLVGGTAAINYPNMASWFNQARFNQFAEMYKRSTNPTSQGDRAAVIAGQEKALDEARAYNDALNAGAHIEAGERKPVGAGITPESHAQYQRTLSDPQGIMATLVIPGLKLELPIYHGTSDRVLLEGIGHLEGTSLPVGGQGTHAVLTAHRGLASAKLFTDLDKVKAGDQFVVAVQGQVLAYRVFDTKVVDPKDTESLAADPGKDLVTLVTCTPLGINSHRILVTGERIIPTPEAAQRAAEDGPYMVFPWWAIFDAAALVLAGVYLWRSGLVVPKRAVPAAAEDCELVLGFGGIRAFAFLSDMIDEGGHHLALVAPSAGAVLPPVRGVAKVVEGDDANPLTLRRALAGVGTVYLDPTAPDIDLIEESLRAELRELDQFPQVMWLGENGPVADGPSGMTAMSPEVGTSRTQGDH